MCRCVHLCYTHSMRIYLQVKIAACCQKQAPYLNAKVLAVELPQKKRALRMKCSAVYQGYEAKEVDEDSGDEYKKMETAKMSTRSRRSRCSRRKGGRTSEWDRGSSTRGCRRGKRSSGGSTSERGWGKRVEVARVQVKVVKAASKPGMHHFSWHIVSLFCAHVAV